MEIYTKFRLGCVEKSLSEEVTFDLFLKNRMNNWNQIEILLFILFQSCPTVGSLVAHHALQGEQDKDMA